MNNCGETLVPSLMKSFAKFGMVAVIAFFVGAVSQSDFVQKGELAHRQPSNEKPSPQASPAEEKTESLATSEPSPKPTLVTVEARAIEHYRAVIQLGVAERLAQQRIHTEVSQQRVALAASAEKKRKLAQAAQKRRELEQEKAERQLILATAKAQEAQADLDHERAQQAALETQWLIKEEQRRREELAFQQTQDDFLRSETQRQKLLNLHAEHQLISTFQARKAKSHRRSHRRESEGPREQREEGNRPRQNHSSQRQQPRERSSAKTNSSCAVSLPKKCPAQGTSTPELSGTFPKAGRKTERAYPQRLESIRT